MECSTYGYRSIFVRRFRDLVFQISQGVYLIFLRNCCNLKILYKSSSVCSHTCHGNSCRNTGFFVVCISNCIVCIFFQLFPIQCHSNGRLHGASFINLVFNLRNLSIAQIFCRRICEGKICLYLHSFRFPFRAPPVYIKRTAFAAFHSLAQSRIIILIQETRLHHSVFFTVLCIKSSLQVNSREKFLCIQTAVYRSHTAFFSLVVPMIIPPAICFLFSPVISVIWSETIFGNRNSCFFRPGSIKLQYQKLAWIFSHIPLAGTQIQVTSKVNLCS